ncbi:MAG: O-antigen ligase family protein [Ruminococcaceae bacterium]|nr:O-antigen ligase family protein [Oscillospiraceae bacterium]
MKAFSILENPLIKDDRKKVLKRNFHDAVYVVGFLCSIIPGPFPALSTVASLMLLGCIAISFFDENFYLYMAMFIYLRYRLLLGDTPVYRFYSYLVVLKFVWEIKNVKFRIAFLPGLFVFLFHSLFATGRFESIRVGLNVIVDCALIYVVLLKLLGDNRLMRKFIFAFMLGGLSSGIFGWTNDEFTKAINVSGAGAQTVSRNFGALSDANFAGLFYSLCIVATVIVKGLGWWVKGIFLCLFAVMLLQTASLSALLMLFTLMVFYIILKFRGKSVIILSVGLLVAIIGIVVILSVPQLREIEAIAGLIIRVEEKLSYIPRGRWDLLTTDRWDIWQQALAAFSQKDWWGKIIGGSVVTVMVIDYNVMSIACHNSYLQSILNFGLLGTAIIYIPLFIVFVYRILLHFSKVKGYDGEDIKILQLVFSFAFIVFGFTVDFFIDWPFMMLYFI